MSDTETLSNNDLDFSGEDGSRPMLDKVTLQCRTGDVHYEDDKRGRVMEPRQAAKLVIPLVLEQAAVATNGTPVHPGFQHTDSIYMVPTGKLTKEFIRDKLGSFQRSALGLKKGEKGRPFVPEELSGKLLMVTFEVEVDRDGTERQRARRFGALSTTHNPQPNP
jgi:hypothetical protein